MLKQFKKFKWEKGYKRKKLFFYFILNIKISYKLIIIEEKE